MRHVRAGSQVPVEVLTKIPGAHGVNVRSMDVSMSASATYRRWRVRVAPTTYDMC